LSIPLCRTSGNAFQHIPEKSTRAFVHGIRAGRNLAERCFAPFCPAFVLETVDYLGVLGIGLMPMPGVKPRRGAQVQNRVAERLRGGWRH